MKAHAWRELAAAALPGAAFAVLLACAAGLLAATMTAAERAALWALAEPRVALLVMLWFFAALVGGVAGHWAWLRFVAAPGRLAEEVQMATGSDRALSFAPAGSDGSRALAAAVNTLAAHRDALRAEIALRVAEGSRAVEQERSRLAALMSELTQSVVVCNLDGRILLFNARARLQFRALLPGAADSAADSAAIGGGTEAIALGRSIYTCSTASSSPMRWKPSSSAWRAVSASLRRSSSPPPGAASCCACRWRLCGPSRPTRRCPAPHSTVSC